MTRPSKRELERAVEDLGGDDLSHASVDLVYIDPVTKRLFDGRGREADPITTEPEADLVVTVPRAMSMSRKRAREENREIIGSYDNPQVDVVSVRVPPAPDVDAESAVKLTGPADCVADFSNTRT